MMWAGYPYSGDLLGVARNMATYNFEAISTSPTYAYGSSQEWADCADRAVDFVNSLLSREGDTPFSSWEARALEKATRACWNNVGFGSLLAPNGSLENSNPAAAETLRPFMVERGKMYVQALRRIGKEELLRIKNESEIPLDRLGVGTLNVPGTDREGNLFLALTHLQEPTYSRGIIREQQLSGMKVRGMILARTQDSRTPTPRIVYHGSMPVVRGESFFPKTRRVKATDKGGGVRTAPFWNIGKACYETATPVANANNPEWAIALAVFWQHLLPFDTPTFDDNQSYEVLADHLKLVVMPMLEELVRLGVFTQDEKQSVIEYYEASLTYEFIAPARFKDEKACIWKVFGKVQSGFRGTTMQGMDLQYCMARYIKFRLGQLGIQVEIGNYGDDLRILTNDPRIFAALRKLLAEIAALFKFDMSVDPDDMFMQVSQGLASPSFSRQLGRKLNRESSEQPLSDIQAAMSLRASYERLCGMNRNAFGHPWRSQFFKAVEYCIPRYRPAIELARRHDLTALSSIAACTVGVTPRWMEEFLSDERSASALFIDQRYDLLARILEKDVTKSPRLGLELNSKIKYGQLVQLAHHVDRRAVDAFWRDAMRDGRSDALEAFGSRITNAMRRYVQ